MRTLGQWGYSAVGTAGIFCGWAWGGCGWDGWTLRQAAGIRCSWACKLYSSVAYSLVGCCTQGEENMDLLKSNNPTLRLGK